MHRFGIVSEVSAATGEVRVVFDAHDNLASALIPVVQPATSGNRAYQMPDLHSQVLCALDEDGEAIAVIGAVYSDADPPPVSSADKVHAAFEDGATLEYDRAAHRLAITLPVAASAVEITVNGDATVTSTGGNIILNVAAAAKVYIGGAAKALRLATEDFVRNIFLKHTHPTPAGMSMPPVATGTELQAPHVTEKGRSE